MAQTISYEIRMALVAICVIVIGFSFSLVEVGERGFIVFILPFIFVMWFVSALAETNRSPFDLAEGESELVSGFNVEYGGATFAFLFIAEYGSILLIRLVTRVLFFSGAFGVVGVLGIVKMMSMAFIFLWVRGTYPRMRYDALMSLTWKTFLSVSLCAGMILFVVV